MKFESDDVIALLGALQAERKKTGELLKLFLDSPKDEGRRFLVEKAWRLRRIYRGICRVSPCGGLTVRGTHEG